MHDLESRLRERLAVLKAECERRSVELAAYAAAIAELEALLAPPPAAPEPELLPMPERADVAA